MHISKKNHFYLRFALVGLDRRRFFVPLRFANVCILNVNVNFMCWCLSPWSVIKCIFHSLGTLGFLCLNYSMLKCLVKIQIMRTFIGGYENFTLNKQREKENSEFEIEANKQAFILFREWRRKKLQLHFARRGCIDDCMCLVGKLWEMYW